MDAQKKFPVLLATRTQLIVQVLQKKVKTLQALLGLQADRL